MIFRDKGYSLRGSERGQRAVTPQNTGNMGVLLVSVRKNTRAPNAWADTVYRGAVTHKPSRLTLWLGFYFEALQVFSPKREKFARRRRRGCLTFFPGFYSLNKGCFREVTWRFGLARTSCFSLTLGR